MGLLDSKTVSRDGHPMIETEDGRFAEVIGGGPGGNKVLREGDLIMWRWRLDKLNKQDIALSPLPKGIPASDVLDAEVADGVCTITTRRGVVWHFNGPARRWELGGALYPKEGR
jgi:hypothetical protein